MSICDVCHQDSDLNFGMSMKQHLMMSHEPTINVKDSITSSTTLLATNTLVHIVIRTLQREEATVSAIIIRETKNENRRKRTNISVDFEEPMK